MKKITIILMIAFIQACGTVGSTNRPQSYYQDSPEGDSGSIVGEVTLGDDDDKINRLLHHQVKLPKKNRIAILRLSRDNSWRFYSNDFTELNDSLTTGLIQKLRSSDRIYDASFLPAMLVPEMRTIPVLREAAARFQADLLLAYRSSCSSYDKYRFISSDETKSYCSVEAIVLDIRSGIIVKSVVSAEDFKALEQPGDTNFDETKKRAELEAVASALGNIAQEIVTYLEDVPIE